MCGKKRPYLHSLQTLVAQVLRGAGSGHLLVDLLHNKLASGDVLHNKLVALGGVLAVALHVQTHHHFDRVVGGLFADGSGGGVKGGWREDVKRAVS